jgi:hypothetical protein
VSFVTLSRSRYSNCTRCTASIDQHNFYAKMFFDQTNWLRYFWVISPVLGMKTLDMIAPDEHRLLIADATAGNLEQVRQFLQSKAHNFRHCYPHAGDSAPQHGECLRPRWRCSRTIETWHSGCQCQTLLEKRAAHIMLATLYNNHVNVVHVPSTGWLNETWSYLLFPKRWFPSWSVW